MTTLDRDEKAAGFAGFVVGLILAVLFTSWFWWISNALLSREIRDMKATAVEYGYAQWVTGKSKEPEFKWVVPPEAQAE